MKVKYNRTSTIQQEGKRFDLDKNEYDLTLFDKGVSGKIPFSERTEGNKLTQLVNDGKVSEVVVEELSRLGRNTIDTLTTLKFFEDNEVNVIVKSMGNLQSMVNGKKKISGQWVISGTGLESGKYLNWQPLNPSELRILPKDQTIFSVSKKFLDEIKANKTAEYDEKVFELKTMPKG